MASGTHSTRSSIASSSGPSGSCDLQSLKETDGRGLPVGVSRGRQPWASVAFESAFHLVGHLLDAVLGHTGRFVDLALALEVVVTGEAACGLLGAPLGVVLVPDLASHRSLLLWLLVGIPLPETDSAYAVRRPPRAAGRFSRRHALFPVWADGYPK